MKNRIKKLKEEIEKCEKHQFKKIRCDVLDGDGNPCNEVVTPMLAMDARATPHTDFEWEYERSYHTGFSCEKHGCVPININGEPTCEDTPEEIFGEFKQIIEAKLKEAKLWQNKLDKIKKKLKEVLNKKYKERHETRFPAWWIDKKIDRIFKEAEDEK